MTTAPRTSSRTFHSTGAAMFAGYPSEITVGVGVST